MDEKPQADRSTPDKMESSNDQHGSIPKPGKFLNDDIHVLEVVVIRLDVHVVTESGMQHGSASWAFSSCAPLRMLWRF